MTKRFRSTSDTFIGKFHFDPMFSQLENLALLGIKNGFLKNLTIVKDSSSIVCQSGPLLSNLFFHFRNEWIKSFVRQSCARYNFLWLDQVDRDEEFEKNFTVGQQQRIKPKEPFPSLILRDNGASDELALTIRYNRPFEDMTLLQLAAHRTRFWKKYLSRRERLECLSSKSNLFEINYRFGTELPTYQLETIERHSDSTFHLILNVNQTLMTLLIDAQIQCLHPLLTTHQIAIRTNPQTLELCLFLSKLLTFKHQLRVCRLKDELPLNSIPFHLILDENSLKNGLCHIWSRDTQLNEEIHVKQVAKRFADYFKALDDFL